MGEPEVEPHLGEPDTLVEWTWATPGDRRPGWRDAVARTFLVTSGRNQRLFRTVATRWAVKEPPEGFEAEPEGSSSTRWRQWIFDFILEAVPHHSATDCTDRLGAEAEILYCFAT